MALTMSRLAHPCVVRLPVVFLTAVLAPAVVSAQAAQHTQPPPPRIVSRDSVTTVASKEYQAGSFKRFWLGDTYRDLWATPIRVPVLDLETYARGLKPLKEGGGNQTKNLRLGARDGEEYVFRPVNKGTIVPPRLRGTGIEKMFHDQVSALFPAAGNVIAPIAEAAGVLHTTPAFTMLPNDSSLGKFRKDFVHKLGTLEEYPTKPDESPGFGGASDIIDTEDLMRLVDSLPNQSVDERAFLAARLVDILVDDTDRHHGNWKWARFGPTKAARWVPIARDRDHAFNHYDGILPRIASLAEPSLSRFEGKYASIATLSENSRQMDRRLLSGLEKPVWDSIAEALSRRVTDGVIDSAVRRMPPEYQQIAPSFAAKLRQRRDGLRSVADKFYGVLARTVEVHGTDADDRATVTYLPGGVVDVELRSGKAEPYYRRRFEPRETDEVRVYLHNGDDSATVRGDVPSKIRVRVIGGNGTNTLADSSKLSRSQRARLYDVGTVHGYYYGPDSAPDTLFTRRPWVKDTGVVHPPGPDFGTRLTPTAGFGTGGLGLVPRVGVRWTSYGFRHVPYSTQLGLDAEYSTGVDGYRLTLLGDHRLESSRVHFLATGRMSDFEVVNFFGYGNQTDDQPEDDVFRVDQRQWQLRPAVALALGRRESDVTLGPVIQYSTTDPNTGRFIAAGEPPYGYGKFGEAGLRLGLRYDARNDVRGATRGFLVDMNSSTFPKIWDVESAFSQVSGSIATYYKVPLPLHPVLALRGGGRKVWGNAPFNEAAFLGGVDTLTGVSPQRYAGDASVFGNSELRVPVASIRTWIPLDVGVLGFADAGRVYLDGESPGGWHKVAGGGVWVGILDKATGVSLVFTSSKEDRVVVGTGLRF